MKEIQEFSKMRIQVSRARRDRQLKKDIALVIHRAKQSKAIYVRAKHLATWYFHHGIYYLLPVYRA
jgi:hypothetical protein